MIGLAVFMTRAERFGELHLLFIAERRQSPHDADNLPNIIIGLRRSKSWHPRNANAVLDDPEQLSLAAIVE